MKAIIIALFIFVAVASIFQVALGSPDFKGLEPWSSSSNVDTKNIEAKLSEALQGLSAAQKSSSKGDNADVGNSNIADNPLNNSSVLNSTAINSSTINLSAINSTANSTSIESDPSSDAIDGSGAVTISGSSSASPQEVGSNSKANFNGFWGMEASQKGTGKNGINSRTFLSGGFEVDKTVKFQDRGY
ncbi:MAG TPA: hypothetical protein VLB04_06055 [Methanotrichaceae archaeon]|nr:hypothetical protein [Methanotrichaceae archaeon]